MNSLSHIRSFNSLFNEYYTRFICFAMGYVNEEEVAEDFVSEAFTIYWEKREELSPDTIPQAFILTVIKNKCLNHLNQLQIHKRVTEKIKNHNEWLLRTKISTLEACDPDFIYSKELQDIIDSTLEKLPEKTKQIFSMSRDKGFTYKEIARKTNLSQKAVEFHISKALHHLRISLSDFISLIPLFFYFS